MSEPPPSFGKCETSKASFMSNIIQEVESTTKPEKQPRQRRASNIEALLDDHLKEPEEGHIAFNTSTKTSFMANVLQEVESSPSPDKPPRQRRASNFETLLDDHLKEKDEGHLAFNTATKTDFMANVLQVVESVPKPEKQPRQRRASTIDVLLDQHLKGENEGHIAFNESTKTNFIAGVLQDMEESDKVRVTSLPRQRKASTIEVLLHLDEKMNDLKLPGGSIAAAADAAADADSLPPVPPSTSTTTETA